MITIRYADLPEGLHAHAQAHGRRTVIYLRPGLTGEQRRRSLRRARQSARMGYGPRLPGAGVALAVARHVTAGTLRNLGAAVRRHPVGSLLLSAGFVTLIACYVLFVTVSVRLMLGPGQTPAAAASPVPGQAALLPLWGGPPGPAPGATGGPRGASGGPQAERHRRAPGPGVPSASHDPHCVPRSVRPGAPPRFRHPQPPCLRHGRPHRAHRRRAGPRAAPPG